MRIKYRVINGGFEDKAGYLYITKKHKKTKNVLIVKKRRKLIIFIKIQRDMMG